MAYSMEFRRAVATAYDECGSSAEVAEQFDCSESWGRRLIPRRRETESLEPRPNKRPNNNNKLTDADMQRLLAVIRKTPDMTLAELAEVLEFKVSVPTVWRATKALGLSLKKVRPRGRIGSSGRQSRAGDVVRALRRSPIERPCFPR